MCHDQAIVLVWVAGNVTVNDLKDWESPHSRRE